MTTGSVCWWEKWKLISVSVSSGPPEVGQSVSQEGVARQSDRRTRRSQVTHTWMITGNINIKMCCSSGVSSMVVCFLDKIINYSMDKIMTCCSTLLAVFISSCVCNLVLMQFNSEVLVLMNTRKGLIHRFWSIVVLCTDILVAKNRITDKILYLDV